MPAMSAVEAWFCRSAPWRLASHRVLSWAIQGVPLEGDVLEIGGGSGAMAGDLLRLHPLLRLTVTDHDPAMVEAARERLGEFPQVTVRQADAAHLPFTGKTFDAVLSFLMLHHVIDWEQTITEVGRVLRPGGQFVGYDLTDSRAASWLHRVDKSPHRLIERQALEPALTHAGLRVSRLCDSFGGRIVRFVAHKAESSI
ncbi:UNVERIFIED_ORG: class I SAM-dependent methyltransferase [Bacillus sp. AZ43]